MKPTMANAFDRQLPDTCRLTACNLPCYRTTWRILHSKTGWLFLFVLLVSLPSLQGQEMVNLQGQWAFQIDRDNKGMAEQWYLRQLTDVITLPGSMAGNNKGDDITLQTRWTGSIYDSSYYYHPRLAKYRQPDNIHIPFWLTPAKHYVGAAWYQRTVQIPQSWEGKRIVLFLERTHIQTRVWVDDRETGMQQSLVTPHQYELPPLKAGSHRITIRIDNHIEHLGVGPDAHSVTDHTQGNWNGIIGNMHLQATANVFIEDVGVNPDVTNNKAWITVRVRNSSHTAIEGVVELNIVSYNTAKVHRVKPVLLNVKLAGDSTGDLAVILPMGKDVQWWDEFHPALYRLTATLFTHHKTRLDEQQTTFGMRDFSIKDRSFLINGHPVFLRGTLNNCEFPLTGYPATDLASWTRIMKVIKAHGLNHVRFHSWCPPEAAFEAADREGVYLQPEGPSWPNHGPKIGVGQYIDTFLYEETRRMAKWYGNHPSFCMLSAGNEPAGDQVRYLNGFVDHWKKTDNRRVYTGMSVGGSWPVVPHAQYQVRGGVRGVNWQARPETMSDFSAGIAPFAVPFVAHEIGQYCAFPDFREIQKYTGVYQAKNFELFQQDLADHGMADRAPDFLMASGKLQALAYKHEMEKMLRTPGYAGFQLLGLQDFPGQGTALVGVLNAFYASKGYITAAEYARFCNVTVPLVRLPKFVYTSKDTLVASVEVAHWGEQPLVKPVFDWTLKTEKGAVVAHGSFTPPTITWGNGQPVGKIIYPLHKVKAAARLNLEVRLRNTRFVNDWNMWVYPDKVADVSAADVYYTTVLDDKARSVLDKGGKVFFNAAGQIIKGKEVVMYFQPVFWNTSWFQMKPPHVTGMVIQNQHKAFGAFPTAAYSDLQWWEIAHKAQVMNLEDFPAGFRPLVQPVDTWFMNRPLGLIWEAKVGHGTLIVSSADLHPGLPADKPAARQLFYSLMQYMASGDCKPAGDVGFVVVKDLLLSPSKLQFNTYTKDSPDELKPTSALPK